MLRFNFPEEVECMRCHHCTSHTCFDDKHTVTCDVKEDLIGKAKVPTYCPVYDYLHGPANGRQMASK